jgi:hypothetical protein
VQFIMRLCLLHGYLKAAKASASRSYLIKNVRNPEFKMQETGLVCNTHLSQGNIYFDASCLIIMFVIHVTSVLSKSFVL